MLFVPSLADAWIDKLYEYEDAGLIDETEVGVALEYMQSVGLLTHDQTVSYSVSGWLGMIPDDEIPPTALEDALDAWEMANPGLRFVENDEAEIDIYRERKVREQNIKLFTNMIMPMAKNQLKWNFGPHPTLGCMN